MYFFSGFSDRLDYWFTLANFLSFLTRLAAEYQLKLIYKAEFHDVYADHVEHPDFGPLLQRMNVVDAKGESQMDEDQWEAASMLFQI